MTDSERINTIIEYLHINVSNLSKTLGLKSPDRLYHILNGRNGISDKLAKIVVDRFPAISYVWLLTGDGEMLTGVGNIPEPKPPEPIKCGNCLYLERVINAQAISIESLQKTIATLETRLTELAEAGPDGQKRKTG